MMTVITKNLKIYMSVHVFLLLQWLFPTSSKLRWLYCFHVYFRLPRKPPELVLERDKGSLVVHDVFCGWK